jgi:hypothetical protein
VLRLGPVGDLAPLYADARVVINPAVAGTGVKIKTLEALSHLRRVVTWPSGVDGLAPEVADLCVTVQDWYEFSRSLVMLLSDTGAATLTDVDRTMLVNATSPTVVYRELMSALDRWREAHVDESRETVAFP